MRSAQMYRETKETQISVRVALDAGEERCISTGIPFFDHMLDLMAKYAFMDLTVECKGDLEVDGHHTVEDIGILLGKVIAKSLGDKNGIRRYGFCWLPMDEALCSVSLDLSGRPYLVYNVPFEQSVMAGGLQAQLAEEFFRAMAGAAGLTLHINLQYGTNAHHILEAVFKSFGYAFAEASRQDSRVIGIPSTKGVLE